MQYGFEKGKFDPKHVNWVIFSKEREVLTLLQKVQVRVSLQ